MPHIPAKGELVIAVLCAAFPAIPEEADHLLVYCAVDRADRRAYIQWSYQEKAHRQDRINLDMAAEHLLLEVLKEMHYPLPAGLRKLVIHAVRGEKVKVTCEGDILVPVEAPDAKEAG